MSKRHAFWLMIGILLGAAVLRLPALSTLPPGLHYDEAANQILAGDIALRGARPIFISSYTGKETFFFYTAAGLMRLLGEHVFTLRLTAAWVGLLTVAASYALGRELFRGRGGRTVAVVAAGLLATSFWHLLFSRLGFRAISQPLWQAITLWLLLRAVRHWLAGARPWPLIVAAGVALGLAGHTYLAVRLFPLLLLLAAVPLRKQIPQLWRPLLLFSGVALLTLSPLLWYFATHPDAFWVRIGQVGGDGLPLAESVWRSLLMFGWRGDPYWRFNWPDMPLLNPLWAVLGMVGMATAVAHWRTADPLGRVRLLLLLLNPLVMLLPTALATNEIVPSNIRAIGLLPLLMYLPAWGTQRGADWLLGRFAPARLRALALLLFALLTAQGAATGWLYFAQWGGRADLFYENDADLAAVADYLNGHMPTDQPVYVATLHVPHPTLAALARDYDALKLIPQGQALVLPADGRATYIFPHNVPVPSWMRPLLPPPALLGPAGPDGQPTFALYRLTQLPFDPLTQPSHPTRANFGHALTLLGYDVGSGPSGSDLPLTLYWQVAAQPPASYLTFAHLEDEGRYRWSQIERDGYPTAQWAAGEIVVEQVRVPIRAGTPPGRYRLRVGWFAAADQRPLARLDEGGRFAGNALLVEDVFVLPATAAPAPLPVPPVAVAAETGVPGLRLLGYEPAPATVTNGQLLTVPLWWAADQPLPELSTRLELMRPNNVGIVLRTGQPAQGRYPFATWPASAFVVDRQTAEIPLNLQSGSYRLQVRLLAQDGATLATYDVGEVALVASERTFSPPALATAVEATFGQQIRLLGYTRTGAELTLVWQAVERPSADYTIFVHLLHPDGTCCVWQVDAMPRAGAYPTSLWLPDEVVVEQYTLALPDSAGQYALEVGVYVAENGTRLAVQGQDSQGDFIYLQPVTAD